MLNTWGDLAKDQTSSQTINQAIDEAIALHEADPEAHLGVGESLEQHKTNTVIDHPADSIVEDKIQTGAVTSDKLLISKYVLDTRFESLTGWSKSSGIFNYLGYMELHTTTVLNNSQEATVPPPDYGSYYISNSKNPIYQARLAVYASQNHISAWGFGSYDADEFIGFKEANGTLYAIWCDMNLTVYTQVITGITVSDYNTYRIEVKTGTGILFYVNGVLKHTAFFPSAGLIECGNRGYYYIKTLHSGSVATLGVLNHHLEFDY